MTQNYDSKYMAHEFHTTFGGNPWAAGWTVESMRDAIDAHDRGYFVHSAAAAIAATRFPPIFGALMQRLGPPLGLTRAVRGGKGWTGEGLGEWIRSDVEDMFRRNLSIGRLGSVFTSIAMMGFAIIQNVWHPLPDSSLIQVTLKPWPLTATTWDPVRKGFRAHTTDGVVDIVHGDGRWTVIEPWGDDSQPSHLMGAVRALGLTYMKGGFADRDEANYSDVHGKPKPVGKLRKGITSKSEEGKEFGGFVQTLGQPRSGGIYPDGCDVKMLEAVGRTELVFEQILKRCASYVAFALVGQDATMQQGTGVYTSPVFEGVKFSLTRAETAAAGAALTEGVARPFTIINYAREDLTPSLEWLLPDLEADQRHKTYGERLMLFHNIISSSRANGYAIDQEESDAIAAALGVESPNFAGRAPLTSDG